MTEQKFIWPVNVTGQYSKNVLSPVMSRLANWSTVIYGYSSDLLGLRMCSDTCHSDDQIKRSELC